MEKNDDWDAYETLRWAKEQLAREGLSESTRQDLTEYQGQLNQIIQYQKPGGESLNREMRKRYAEKYGVTEDLVTDVGLSDRAKIGFLADTPQETKAALQQAYPDREVLPMLPPWTSEGGSTDVIFMLRDPKTNEAQMFNPSGLDVGDVAQGAAAAILPAAGAIAGGLTGPLAPVAMPALTYGGEMLRQGAQSLAGTQRQPLTEQLRDAAITTALDVGTAGIGHGIGRGTNLAVRGPGGPRRADFQAIGEGQAAAVRMGTPQGATAMRYQVSESPILQRMATQAEQAGPGILGRGPGKIAETKTTQQADIVRAAQALTPQPSYMTAQSLRDLAVYRHGQELGKAKGPLAGKPPSLEAAGAEVGDTLKSGQQNLRQLVREQYAEVDSAAARERPEFDHTGALKTLDDQGVTARKTTEVADTPASDAPPMEVVEYIDISKPDGVLSRTRRVLENIDPKQENYRVYKTLRTEMGRLADTTNDGALGYRAKQIRDSLDDVLDNPTNLDPETSAFVRERKLATRAAREDFRLRESAGVKKAYGAAEVTDEPATIAKGLYENPGSFGPRFRGMITSMSDKSLDTVQRGFTTRLLDEPNATDALTKYMRDYPENAKVLMPEAQRGSLMAAARQVDRFRASGFNDLIRAQEPDIKMIGELLDSDATNPRATSQLLSRMGGKGSPGQHLLNTASIHNLLDKAVDRAVSPPQFSHKGFTRQYHRMKESGQLDIMPEDTQKVLKGLEAQLRLTQFRANTSGAGLETAAMIGGLMSLDPSLMAASLVAIQAKPVVARFLATPKIARAMVKNSAKPEGIDHSTYLRSIGLGLGSLADSYDKVRRAQTLPLD